MQKYNISLSETMNQGGYPPEHHNSNHYNHYGGYQDDPNAHPHYYNEDPNAQPHYQGDPHYYENQPHEEPNYNNNGYYQDYKNYNEQHPPQEEGYYGEYQYKNEEKGYNQEHDYNQEQHNNYYNEHQYAQDPEYNNQNYPPPKNNYKDHSGAQPHYDHDYNKNHSEAYQDPNDQYYNNPEGYDYHYDPNNPYPQSEEIHNNPEPYAQESQPYNDFNTNRSQVNFGGSAAYHHSSVKQGSKYGNYSGYEAAIHENMNHDDPNNYVQHQQFYPNQQQKEYEMDPEAHGAARKVYPPVNYLNYEERLYKTDHEDTDPNRPATPRENSVNPDPNEYYTFDLNLKKIMETEHLKLRENYDDRVDEDGKVIALQDQESSDEEEGEVEEDEKKQEKIKEIIEQFKNRKYKLFEDPKKDIIKSFHKSQFSIFGNGNNDKIKTTYEVYDDSKYTNRTQSPGVIGEITNLKVFDVETQEEEEDIDEKEGSVYSDISQDLKKLDQTIDDSQIKKAISDEVIESLEKKENEEIQPMLEQEKQNLKNSSPNQENNDKDSKKLEEIAVNKIIDEKPINENGQAENKNQIPIHQQNNIQQDELQFPPQTQSPQQQKKVPFPQNTLEQQNLPPDAINTQNYHNQQMNNIYPQHNQYHPQEMYNQYPQSQMYQDQHYPQYENAQYDNPHLSQGMINNYTNDQYNPSPEQALPQMNDKDRKELLEMYPYMENQPEEVILNFWRNMKQLSERIGNADSLDPQDIKMLEDRDKNKFDESRTSEMIKQELRRKKKWIKKKKIRRKETGDYNMIDNISEFSRGTHIELKLHSVMDHNRHSRSVSISSMQKSEPELVFTKSKHFEVKSEENSVKGSRRQTPVNRGLQSSKKNPVPKTNGDTQLFVENNQDPVKKFDSPNYPNQPQNNIPPQQPDQIIHEQYPPYPTHNQEQYNNQEHPHHAHPNAYGYPHENPGAPYYYQDYGNQGYAYGGLHPPPQDHYPNYHQDPHHPGGYYYDQYQNPPPGSYPNHPYPGYPSYDQHQVPYQNQNGQGYGEQVENEVPKEDLQGSQKMQEENQKNNADNLGLEDEEPLLEQCKHKKLTGKLQRKLREMNDHERLEVFKILKSDFLDICCDPYGKYVATLFLSFNLPAIHDATVSFFDRNMETLVKDQYGIKYCQKIVEVKFKDKRVKRTIKRLVNHLEDFIMDKYASLCVLSYVNQTTGDELNTIAEFCKENITKCIENENITKIISKLIKKVKTGIASELILYLRKVIIELIRNKKGKELVEVFFDHASKEDREYVIQFVLASAASLIHEKETQYVFYKLVELELVDWIDRIIDFLVRDSDQPQRSRLVNQCVSSRSLQILFLKASKQRKGILRDAVYELKQTEKELTDHGRKLEELVNKYFQS